MENLFVWIVLFAGGAIVLLGVFLAASERELKKKRREVEELMAGLPNLPGSSSSTAFASTQPVNGAEVTGLRAKNQELQKEVATLAYELDESRRINDELLATQKRTVSDQPEIQQLRATNGQLRAEVDDLRNRLQTSETRIRESAGESQGSVDRQSDLEKSIAELKQQLETSQTKIRELEKNPAQAADSELIETSHRAEKQRLEAKIGDLEKELATGSEKIRELGALRERLAESERAQHELREEKRRRDEEIPLWQARAAEGEESSKKLAALQSPYEKLLAEQISIAERQQRFQEDLTEFARLIATPSATNGAAKLSPSSTNHHLVYLDTPANDADHDLKPNQRPDPLSIVAPEPYVAAAQSEPKPKRRFGIFRPLIVIAVVGALAAALWSNSSDQPASYAAKQNASPVADAEKKPAAMTVSSSSKSGAPETPLTPTVAKANEPATAAAKEQASTMKPAKSGKTDTRVAGTYEITRAARVFAAPTEFSQLVGEIEPGLKVNVVNARDGWLEVHSKHGRPPGFIRKEVASRVDG
jgi:hypothetical protein